MSSCIFYFQQPVSLQLARDIACHIIPSGFALFSYRGPIGLFPIRNWDVSQYFQLSIEAGSIRFSGVALIGPMKGVFPTPDTGPFFSSDTDIQPKVNVVRHLHSESVTRHLTLHFRPTLTVSFPSRRLTFRPLFMGPTNVCHTGFWIFNFSSGGARCGGTPLPILSISNHYQIDY